MKKKTIKNSIIVLLTSILLMQSATSYAEILPVEVQADTTQETKPRTESEAAINPQVYEDGVIKIYNFKQLQAIGTTQPVTTLDDDETHVFAGEPIQEDGKIITYASDANYQIMQDIAFEAHEVWTLPSDFSGTFLPHETNKAASLYDESTNQITICNNYQLLLLASYPKKKEPVLSHDLSPAEVGMGTVIYPTNNKQEYLYYDDTHHYVLSKYFTEQMPELKTKQIQEEKAEINDDLLLVEGEDLAGRTFPGQVLYIDPNTNETYILIGNEAQLRAIGSNKQVTPRLYIYNPAGILGGLLGSDPTYTPYYPGDADLGLELAVQESATYETGILGSKRMHKITHETFLYYERYGKYELADADLHNDNIVEGILDVVGGILGTVLFGKSKIVSVDETGRPDYHSEQTIKTQFQDVVYSSDANYIIFRDIDTAKTGINSNEQDDAWIPIHTSGNVEGRLQMQEDASITISNIHVEQGQTLDPSTTNGIGFFGTISSKMDTQLFTHTKQAVVKNINLQHVTIDNQAIEVNQDVGSLVDGVLQFTGGILGGVLGIVDDLLGFVIPGLNLHLSDVIEDLLTVQTTSLDIYATGSFAGRISGNVRIENCHVQDASITTRKQMSGGFVGYSEGVSEYSGLSQLLGGSVELLATLLNILPGVGLDDLITVLLQNDIALGELIPTNYYQAQIINSSVTLANPEMGTLESDYHGGFIGVQTATKIQDSFVSGLNKVQARNGAGGFAGMERDAIIQSALKDLGIELSKFEIQAKQEHCTVNGTQIKILAQENYAGGFNGVMTSSISSNTSVAQLAQVSAQNYAGGFVGRATLGYGSTLGSQEDQTNTLLGSVGNLVGELLAPENADQLHTLLALIGLTPSVLQGVQVHGEAWSVQAQNDYAGGLVGQGDGTRIASIQSTLVGLQNVEANRYAGGISGSLACADAIGILNQTLGVGSYIPFSVENVLLQGNHTKIQAKQSYAGGGIGLALGGSFTNLQVEGLYRVEAQNYVGGFAARLGTSGLADVQGLDLLGLGLIKIDHLLSVVEGIAITIQDVSILGESNGLSILAQEQEDAQTVVLAGGFAGEAVGVQISDASIQNLKEVKAYKSASSHARSYAGGWIASSHTGGLLGLAQEQEDGTLQLPGLLEINSLLKILPYLTPNYQNCTVTFTENTENITQVEADVAGGFIGEMEAGQVQNTKEQPSVQQLDYVLGNQYAGGFAGNVHAGAAASSDGLKLLDGLLEVDLHTLLDVLQVYVPQITNASVYSSQRGLMVHALDDDSYAGGYIGHASGTIIDASDVTTLRMTSVTPPSGSLEASDGSSYLEHSQYAIQAGAYAGGYIGCLDLDSAAAIGQGIRIGNLIDLDQLLSVLDVVMSKVSNSHVEGAAGGFSVLANGKKEQQVQGDAGGFVGKMSGSQIINSSVTNFAYIIGQDSAGGFSGWMEPGNVASVLEHADILHQIVNIDEALASLLTSFVSKIEDSYASAIPCGGVIRAQQLSDGTQIQGVAGGFVGYDQGGTIIGKTKESTANRIRSVYGGEYAGGFVGLMTSDRIAETGNLSLLFGLVKVNNLLQLLQSVEATTQHTAVYGPLRNLDMETWNAWVASVGKDGVYGNQLPMESVTSEQQLQEKIKQYAYGYHVVTKRTQAASQSQQGGIAGGYAGGMVAGTITDAHAWDVKLVQAYTSAGGFIGEMRSADAAKVGNVEILGLDITNGLDVLQTYMPNIYTSSVTGYQSGLKVNAIGIPNQSDRMEKVGYAGGFVGHILGGSIQGEKNTTSTTYGQSDAQLDSDQHHVFVDNLRSVHGRSYVGGFVGLAQPASALAVDSASSSGLLAGWLQKLIHAPNDLLQVLKTSVSILRYCDVFAWDPYGISIQGAYSIAESPQTQYAIAAGGFAGALEGTQVGDPQEGNDAIRVENLKMVSAGEYAGGFFGQADVSSVIGVSMEGETSILEKLLSLEKLDLLESVTTAIYHAQVVGVEKGLEITAHTTQRYGYENDAYDSGNAGGFGGAMQSGIIQSASISNLSFVKAPYHAGGFVGYLGKSSLIQLEEGKLLEPFLGLSVGVLDLFGTTIKQAHVSGMTQGFHVESVTPQTDTNQTAGGFVGLADLSRIEDCTVDALNQVKSRGNAGGFVGETTFAYLADVKANAEIVNFLLQGIQEVLHIVYTQGLEQLVDIQLDLGIIQVKVLEQDVIELNALGLIIRLRIDKEQEQAYDVVDVAIGDSHITLKCDKHTGQIVDDTAIDQIQIGLIKANRTKITHSQVSGIAQGYDVFGANSSVFEKGDVQGKYAGGFVGYNQEGLLANNDMFYADVILGIEHGVGPFSGHVSSNSNWQFQDVFALEGENNHYRIYRNKEQLYPDLIKGQQSLQEAFVSEPNWNNVYIMKHLVQDKLESFQDYQEAQISDGKTQIAANVYLENGAKAQLMDDAYNAPSEPDASQPPPDMQDPCKESVTLQIRKIWKQDDATKRPQELHFHITRGYYAQDVWIQDETFQQDITLTSADMSAEDIWEKTISNETWKAYYEDANGKRYYYVYQISEDAVDGYQTTIAYDGEYHYTMVITNTKETIWNQLLPQTGGRGIQSFMVTGLLLICIYRLTRKRKEERRQ